MAVVNDAQVLGTGTSDLVLNTRGRIYVKIGDRYYNLDFKNLGGNTTIIKGRSEDDEIQDKEENVTPDLSDYVTYTDMIKRLNSYVTKRTWNDVVETQKMLQNALLDGFTESITPITVQTMQLTVGDKNLQYEFIKSFTNDTMYTSPIYYKNGILVCGLEEETYSIIKHYTIDAPSQVVASVGNEYNAQTNQALAGYCRWRVKNENIRLQDSSVGYYIYIRVPKLFWGEGELSIYSKTNSDQSYVQEIGTFVQSETAIEMESESGYYYFLFAIVNSEDDEGNRSIATMNGYAEITPGQVRAYRFASPDGKSYIDFTVPAFNFGNKFMYDGVNNKLTLYGAMIQKDVNSAPESTPLTFRGAWGAGTEYWINDVVSYNEQTYVCIKYIESSSVTPDKDSEYFALFVARGNSGYNTATIYLYSRTTSAIPNVQTTYKFSDKSLSPIPTNWSRTIPDGTNPVYVTVAIASSQTDTDIIAANEWSTPVVLSKNGENGNPGLNTAQLFVYKRAKDKPDKPGECTYTFASGALTGTLNGWSLAMPTFGSDPVWVSHAMAASTGNSDTITAGEWSAVEKFVENGKDGDTDINKLRQRTRMRAWKGGEFYNNGTVAEIGIEFDQNGTSITSGVYYSDFVYYSGNDTEGYYKCIRPHNDANIKPTNINYWVPENEYEFVASKVGFFGEGKDGWVIDKGEISHTSENSLLNSHGDILLGKAVGASELNINTANFSVNGSDGSVKINGSLDILGTNAITMHDSDGNRRLKIDTKILDEVPQERAYTLSNRSISDSWRNDQINNNVNKDFNINLADITVENNENEITIPQIDIHLNIYNNGEISGSAEFDISGYFVIDGNTDFGSDWEQRYILESDLNSINDVMYFSKRTLKLDKGNHTISLRLNCNIIGDNFIGTDITYFSASYSYGYTIYVKYPIKRTEIGPNGMRVMFSSSEYAELVKVNDTTPAQFAFRVGNYGLRVTSSGLKKMTNGKDWVDL